MKMQSTIEKNKTAQTWFSRLMRYKTTTPIVLLILGITLIGCPSAPSDMEDFISYEMKKEHIPGLAAAIIKNGEIVWSKGFGYANIKEDRKVTEDTLFHLASISKTVTGTAVMQLWEQGKIDLDAGIEKILGYSILNPFYPDDVITPRMLLTHTSTLQGDSNALGELYTYGADSPISLEELIQGMFLPQGKWYDAARCFLNAKPGTAREYSNLGFALLGLLVEKASGESFDAYCREHIFKPLGMDEADWFLTNLDQTHIAMPYLDLGLIWPIYIPYGQYGYPDYPSGQLRVSVNQFAHFFIAFMNGGEFDGTSILAPATVDEMLKKQIPDIADYQGLPWLYFKIGDTDVVGHAGGEQGTSTIAFFTNDKKIGVILLTTGDPCGLLTGTRRVDRSLPAICERLLKEGVSY
jgi:CubicO group peptidase (beta-lactamase class C family)